MSGGARRMLVTGGAGFIGSHLVEALRDAGHGVRVLDDLSTGRERHLRAVSDQIELVRADVADGERIRQAAAGVDTIFHLAASPAAGGDAASRERAHATNVVGTVETLEAARHMGVRRVVLASSGRPRPAPAAPPHPSEASPEPAALEAIQKRAAEMYLRLYGSLHGLEGVALRFFDVYGPRQPVGGGRSDLVARSLRRLLDEEPTEGGEANETVRDLLFVRDAVRALIAAADDPRPVGRVLDVASGRETSVGEILREASAILGGASPAGAGAPEVSSASSCAELGAAWDTLDFWPTVPLDEGLAHTIAFIRESNQEIQAA